MYFRYYLVNRFNLWNVIFYLSCIENPDWVKKCMTRFPLLYHYYSMPEKKNYCSILQAGPSLAFIGCRMVDMSSNMRLILASTTKIVSSDKVSMKMKLWPRLWWWVRFIVEMWTRLLHVWPPILIWLKLREPLWFYKWTVSLDRLT